MFIRKRTVGEITILDLHGKITLGEGDELLENHVDRLINAGRPNVILGLRNVPYIDSSGNGEIVRTFSKLRRAGGRMVLLDLTRGIQDLLVMTKLLTVFDTYDDEFAALASFSAAGRTSVCPVCRLRAAITSRQESIETCLSCSSRFAVRSEPGVGWIVDEIRLPTYEHEEIVVRGGAFWTIFVNGRLDLFSSESVEEAWRAIPRPRRVLIDLGHAVDTATPKGMAAITALCEPEMDGGRTAVLIEAGTQSVAGTAPPFFSDRAVAIAALGRGTAKAMVVEVFDGQRS